MDFNVEEILKLAADVSLSKEINLIDIPYIDLYMDQVTTLFEDKLSHLKREEDEPILTKTMINNYAKAKILPPVKNKKYSKQQIIMLILIYNLKQILSLDDIKSLFSPIVENLTLNPGNSTSMDELYSKFLNIKELQREEFTDYMDKGLEFINKLYSDENESSMEFFKVFLTVLTLINSANLQKRMAERLIDDFFMNKETKNKN